MSKQTFVVEIEAKRPISLAALTSRIIEAAALAQEFPCKGEVELVRVRPVIDPLTDEGKAAFNALVAAARRGG